MKVNPFYDSLQFILGNTGDHQLTGVLGAWFLTLLFIALLTAGAWIAWREWTDDPAQRTQHHLSIWLMRTLIGCMWFQGSLWKLPLPVSGGLSYWTQQMAEHAAFSAHSWLVTNVMLPALFILDPIVYLTELGMAVAFILGFLVRPLSVIGMLFTLHLWLGLYRHPGEWPWSYIFLVFTMAFFFLTHAGRSLGLDGRLARNPAGIFKGNGMIADLYRRFS